MAMLFVNNINNSMRRTGNLIDSIAETDNLLLAFYKAQRGKQAKQEVVEYRTHLWKHIAELSNQIRQGNVIVGHYNTFKIFDPKERLICAAPFCERVLHHALMNVCHPYFERVLIYDTYATRINKGVYLAIERARRASIKCDFVAKLDVRKYFDSISHAVLKTDLARLFKDPVLLRVFYSIIDSYHSDGDKGLPIGNLTSQYFANLYLSPLDHYAKERLKIPYYVRYMDDILLFGSSRDEVRGWTEELSSQIEQRSLTFKSPVFKKVGQSFPFLGYRIAPHYIGLNSRSKNRFAQKLTDYNRLYSNGSWDDITYHLHITPLLGFAQYAYTKGFRKQLTIRSEIVR